MAEQSPSSDPLTSFGPNEWLVDELYEQYQKDKNSVDRAWWDFFRDYEPGEAAYGRGTPGHGGRVDANGAPRRERCPRHRHRERRARTDGEPTRGTGPGIRDQTPHHGRRTRTGAADGRTGGPGCEHSRARRPAGQAGPAGPPGAGRRRDPEAP